MDQELFIIEVLSAKQKIYEFGMYSQFQVVYTSKNTKINRQKFDDYRDLLQDHSEEKDIERV